MSTPNTAKNKKKSKIKLVCRSKIFKEDSLDLSLDVMEKENYASQHSQSRTGEKHSKVPTIIVTSNRRNSSHNNSPANGKLMVPNHPNKKKSTFNKS